MSDIESDFHHYQDAKDDEGGLHPGRSTPGRGLLWSVAAAIAILILSGVVLALLRP